MLTSTATLIALATSTALIAMVWSLFSGNKWNPSGRHCYITGGSAGLGLALAVILTKKGADVSIVARNEENLAKALAELEAARVTPNQVLRSYSYSLTSCAAAEAALEAACEPHGGETPEAIFLCAGSSRPGFFVEETEESMKTGMDNTYWLAAWSALAASKRMIRTRTKGKIVFVSSILGYMSMLGYSTYSPGKHAIRGLAETLRQELLLYCIDIHIYFPATIYSPGYIEENKTKPKLLLKLEEKDEGKTPENAAQGLYKGLQRGDFHITDTFITEAFRNYTRGATPQNGNFAKDMVYGIIGYFGITFWRRDVDKQVIEHRQAHEQYLTSVGLLPTDK